jgi:catechol 2,3-dioxygenase-like lactoylglutathione lyase family enzyme
MRRLLVPALSLIIVLWPGGAARAQLFPPNDLGVTMGHLHYKVRDVDANKKFWIALGATPVKIDRLEALKFHSVFIFLDKGESSGGTEGSVVNHVGFKVPNTRQGLERLKTAGYKTELAASGTGKVGSVYSPEGERIEFLEDMSVNVKFVPDKGPYVQPTKMTDPIILHHIHLYVPEDSIGKAKAWYVKVFGGVPGKRYKTEDPPYEAVDIPGVNMNFAEAHGALAPTKGRMLDHIGFEVKNLQAFCKKLEAGGIKLDSPYKKLPSGVAMAFLTDPWGTYIELTEGLDRY